MEPKRLSLPLLPRREEQAQIRQALNEAREGGVRVVFLGGHSGTGKSCLVDNALSITADSPIWHARTKFDQRKSNAPLTNLRYLISDLVDYTSEAQCCSLLKRNLDGPQYQVLKAFLMDGDISDSEAEDSDEEEAKWDDSEQFQMSNSTETQKDAMSVLTSTLKAALRIISNVTTVVMTMDDIHWGCKITEHVLRAILTDESLKNVLICATYRTNEETSTEGFYEWKKQLETEMQALPDTDYVNIALDNLTQPQVQVWLAEALSREMDDTIDLANTVFGFTHGNLFFTKHFMEKLQDDELLTFDFNQFKWQWDVDKIKRRSSLSDNVVQSLTSRLKKLPEHVQHVLMLASCFGAQFDIRAVEASKDALGVDCVYYSCGEALKQDFVVKLSKTHYKFTHDMIQLAAYGLLPEAVELTDVHWKIGCLLVTEEELLKDDVIFFGMVDHLNLGADTNLEGCSVEKQCLLAKVNYKAGCKASKLSSFYPATRYLNAGINALGCKPFERHYELALKLYTLAASTEYVVGHIDECLAAAGQVWEHGRDCKAKLPVLEITFDCYAAQNDAQGLLDQCFKKLEFLGIKFPQHPNSVYAQLEYQKTKSRIKSMSDEDFLALPPMESFEKLLTLNLLCRLIYPVYQKEEVNLAMVIACHAANVTLTHGWSKKNSGQSLIMVATFIAAQSHDIREAHRLGRLAEKMTRRDGVDGDNAQVVSLVPSICRWWLEPVPNGLDMFQECYRVAMKEGKIGNAFQATVAYSINYFYAGLPLEPLLQDVERYCNQYLEYSQMTSFFIGSPTWQCLLCLTDKEKNPGSMYEGKIYAMRNKLGNSERTGEQSIKSYQMLLSYYLGDLPTATKMSEDLSKINPGIMKASFWYTSRRFILALVAIANYRLTKQSKDRATAEKHLKYFRTVVKEGAINLVHKLQMLEAEMLTLGSSTFDILAKGTSILRRGSSNDTDTIAAKYDEAIVSASRSGFVQDAALANYLGFQYCKDKPDRSHMAELYLKRSFELWMSWGAVAVAKSLTERHKDFFGSESVRDSLKGMKGSSTSGSSLRGRSRFDADLSLQHKELNVN